ncbi:MAG: trigger factor [Candidatus Kerfeldbacteria bacterium RIFCSPHIGHO2_12_FULL_48_17]|uniref:Trigger factor n=1 Tax=Candidatus Kerfeldbacteria bacterium RIFCSPHIGHO2_12_FULL_48_17 TaxID=1798542 RepID=A0A1G2B3H9_9BACT|nr:MAG: trigger factor [Candidatus Kerfeldbacteria bacterium RIFCSPHIGHO2_12_FULL_48_17]
MKVTYQKLPKSRGEITVELSVSELRPYLEKTAEKISKEVKVAGFRPGHIPYDILKKNVGEATIYEEALRLVVEKTLPEAIVKERLELVGQPQIQPEKLAPGNPLVYKAALDLYPEVTLGDFTALKTRPEEVKVEDADVQKSLDELRKLRAKETAVMRAAKKGDRVKMDFDVMLDKVVIENGSYKGQTIELGEGNFIPGFEEQLAGVKKGEKKEFELKFPKEYHEKNLAGKQATFKVNVHDVYEIELPEMNDEWAKSLGMFKTFTEMKEAIAANLRREKEGKVRQKFEQTLIEEAVKKTKFGDLPENLVKSETDRMLHELERDLTKQGGKFDDYLTAIKKSREDLQKDFVPQAEKRMKASLVLAEVAKKENIQATMEEVAREREAAKLMYKDQPQLLSQLESADYERYIRSTLTNQKVVAFLADKAKDKK